MTVRPVDRYPLSPENAKRVARSRLSMWRTYTVHETHRRITRVWMGMTAEAYAKTLAHFEDKALQAQRRLHSARREHLHHSAYGFALTLWWAQVDLYKCQEEVKAVKAAMRLSGH